jgi:hypothetical protein
MIFKDHVLIYTMGCDIYFEIGWLSFRSLVTCYIVLTEEFRDGSLKPLIERSWNGWWDGIQLSGWWFGTWILYSISYMGCHPSHWLSYFQDGWNHQPDVIFPPFDEVFEDHRSGDIASGIQKKMDNYHSTDQMAIFKSYVSLPEGSW